LTKIYEILIATGNIFLKIFYLKYFYFTWSIFTLLDKLLFYMKRNVWILEKRIILLLSNCFHIHANKKEIFLTNGSFPYEIEIRTKWVFTFDTCSLSLLKLSFVFTNYFILPQPSLVKLHLWFLEGIFIFEETHKGSLHNFTVLLAISLICGHYQAYSWFSNSIGHQNLLKRVFLSHTVLPR